MKCLYCGKGGLFRRIDKKTGLCSECARYYVSGSKAGIKEITGREKSQQDIDDSNRFETFNDFDVIEDAAPIENMGTLSRAQIEDMGLNADDFDDFDRLEVESILRDREEARENVNSRNPGYEPEEEPKPIQNTTSSEESKVDDLKNNPAETDYSEEEHEREYIFPPIDLLKASKAEDVEEQARRDREKGQLLVETLQSYGLKTKLTEISHGPAVTRFELHPAMGIKMSEITSLSGEIALHLAAKAVRIEAPIPGKSAVGIDIPNNKVETVFLRDVLESREALEHPSKIAVALGKDSSNRCIMADIAEMSHILIGGKIGSGKTICIYAMIASILFRASPEEVRLLLIDTKMVELSIYNNIPHLVCPVVTDPKKAASALDWAVAEMMRRCKLFAAHGVRDLKDYNKALMPDEKPLPQIVIIIDELADLMMVSPGEIEDSICMLGQKGSNVGIHMIISTYRPSAENITKSIRSFMPTRIAFSTASYSESRLILGESGAEKLLGRGEMLLKKADDYSSQHIWGPWISDDEVHSIVETIRHSSEAVYDPDMVEHLENSVRTDAEKEEVVSEYDPKLAEAVEIVLDIGHISISILQRRMRIGYARAGRLIDEMAQRGIVSEADGAKPRLVLVTREQVNAMFENGIPDKRI